MPGLMFIALEAEGHITGPLSSEQDITVCRWTEIESIELCKRLCKGAIRSLSRCAVDTDVQDNRPSEFPYTVCQTVLQYV